MHTGTVADTPEAVKPLEWVLLSLQDILTEELSRDPVPQITLAKIKDSTQWLHSAKQAMRTVIQQYSPEGLRDMDDAGLALFAERVRESAMRLSILHGDSSRPFGGEQATGSIQLCNGPQSQEIRSKLWELAKFLDNFGRSQWLGDLFAPEFELEAKTAISILGALQATKELKKTEGDPWKSRSTKKTSSEKRRRLYDHISAEPKTGVAQLERLSSMALVLAQTCEQDAEVHRQRMDALEEKMEALKFFIVEVSGVPEVLRHFVLLRIGIIDGHSELKRWVSAAEAMAALRQLEQLREAIVEERLIRRLSKRKADSQHQSNSSRPSPGEHG